MNILYFIFLLFIFVILLILVIPLKIKVKLNISTKENKNEEDLQLENKLEIYILRFLKIKTIDLKKKDRIIKKSNESLENTDKQEKNVIDGISKLAENIITYEKRNSLIIDKKDLRKLLKSISFNEFYLILGFNFKEPILNSYIIAVINSFINIYLAQNIDKFKMENTAYKTYISNKIIDFHFFSIINFKLVNNIIIIFKIILKLRKVVNKNG